MAVDISAIPSLRDEDESLQATAAPASPVDVSDIPSLVDQSIADIPSLAEPAADTDVSKTASFVQGATQAVSFNFADELESAYKSATSDESYEDVLKKVRARYEAAKAANPKTYLAGEVAGTVPTTLIPGLGEVKGANIIAKLAAQGAVSGAVSGLGETEHLSDVKQTAKDIAEGAAFGGAIGGGAGLVGKGIAKVFGGKEGAVAKTSAAALKAEAKGEAPKILDIVEEATADKLPIWEKEAEELGTVLKGGELKDAVKQNLLDFSEHLGGKRNVEEAIEVVSDLKSRLSDDDFKKAYERFKTDEAMTSKLAGLAPEEPKIKTQLKSLRNSLVDGMSVARDIDKRAGTNFYGTLLEGSRRIAQYQVALAEYLIKKVKLSYAYNKLDDVAKSTLYDALNGSGKFGPKTVGKELVERSPAEIEAALPDALKQPYQEWRKFFSEAADEGNTLLGGPVIKKRTHYVPNQMMDMPKAIVAVEQEAAKVAQATKLNPFNLTSNTDVTKFADVKSPMHNLYRAVQYMTGEAPKTADEFSSVLRRMTEPGSDVFVNEIKASALFKRSNLLPDFLKEKDIVRLSNKWGQQVLRYGHMKDTLAELQQQAGYLKKAGFASDAEKMQRLHDEFLGQARFIASGTRSAKALAQTSLLRAAQEAKSPLAKNFFNKMAEVPDILQDGVLNVYPNFLGANLRAPVQNLLGGLYMVVPELGTIYGTRAVIPAYLKAFANLVNPSYWKALEEKGYIAPQWTTAMKEMLRSGRAPGVAGRVSDATANAAMFAFEWSEKLNRAVAYETSQLLAQDAMKGGKSALKYIDTMPERIKRDTLKFIAEGKEAEVSDLITRYVADRTAFSYNRLTSSELSRAVGPLFSMFTKYPSVIGGRIMDIYAQEGKTEGTKRLLQFIATPLVFGSAINAMFEPGSSAEEALFGTTKNKEAPIYARGATLSAPVFSVKSIVEGRMFTPPLVGATKETLLGLMEATEGDPSRLSRAMKNGLEAFTPGGIPAWAKLYEKVTGENFPIIGKEEK